MKQYKTRKGAASIYIVIFTTTLLGIIALSFTRIMVAESSRTTNYSLSQSAYNSALAGVEDAKIVLLRYQSCVNKDTYASSKGSGTDCNEYKKLFGSSSEAFKTAEKCDTVGKLLHNTKDEQQETLIQTKDDTDTGTIDQAYTCVKIAAYTEDFLATLNDDNPTKIVPLRTETQATQNNINRIQVQWFDQQNYQDVSENSVLKEGYTGFWKNKDNKSDLKGMLTTNNTSYSKKTAEELGNKFTESPLAPPVLQVSMIQTADTFTTDQFYASAGTGPESQTNRGTLMLRPSSASIDLLNERSNQLPRNSLAYSANKSYNTPIDVYCEPPKPTGTSEAWNYACSADFYVPKPINYNADTNPRDMTTSFLVVNLPYGKPTTHISVKMYSCQDPDKSLSEKVTDTVTGNEKINCETLYFANVQPMVDSTGRANDLFRRVESRVELADTNFPIANYALAMTDPNNEVGVEKDFYVTKDCSYSSSSYDASENKIKKDKKTCPNSGKATKNSDNNGKGNGEKQ